MKFCIVYIFFNTSQKLSQIVNVAFMGLFCIALQTSVIVFVIHAFLITCFGLVICGCCVDLCMLGRYGAPYNTEWKVTVDNLSSRASWQVRIPNNLINVQYAVTVLLLGYNMQYSNNSIYLFTSMQHFLFQQSCNFFKCVC